MHIRTVNGCAWATLAAHNGEATADVAIDHLMYDEDGGIYILAHLTMSGVTAREVRLYVVDPKELAT